MINYQQILSQLQNNQQIMGNKTVQNVFNLRNRNDHNGLVELYKNTCQTVGQQPNPMFLR